MRIGIDARELIDKPTGVGRYLAGLLAEWATRPECAGHRFVLYTPRAPDRLPPATQRLVGAAGDGRFQWQHVPGRGGTWWEQVGLTGAVNHDALDVLLAPAYSAPLAVRPPVVLVIHDLSFVARPDWFGAREGFRRRWIVRCAARRARRILTISEFSRSEIIERLKVPPDRVRVIPLGVSLSGRWSTLGAREPLVLFVGSIFNRRRVPDLLEAFAEVVRRQPAARLAIVGENRTYPYQDLPTLARIAGVADRVTIHRYLSDEALVALYGRARVFAFLSEYEGFGLTPLEALAAGAPIVVLDTPVAREIYGDAAVFVRRGDVAATADAILTLLRDEEAGRALVNRAAPLLKRYTWTRSARETLSVVVEAAGRV